MPPRAPFARCEGLSASFRSRAYDWLTPEIRPLHVLHVSDIHFCREDVAERDQPSSVSRNSASIMSSSESSRCLPESGLPLRPRAFRTVISPPSRLMSRPIAEVQQRMARCRAACCSLTADRNAIFYDGKRGENPLKQLKEHSGHRQDYESKQSTLGKGRFTRIAETMRESGEALVQRIGVTRGMKVLDLGCGDGTTAIPGGTTRRRMSSASISPVTWSQPATARGESSLGTQIPGRRRHQSRELADEAFDLVISIFGAMLRPALRRRKGDGARDPARRPDRDGQLDSKRSDPGRSDFEDQLQLHAATAGRFR